MNLPQRYSVLEKEAMDARVRIDTPSMTSASSKIKLIQSEEIRKMKSFLKSRKFSIPFEQKIKKDIYQVNEIYVSDVESEGNSHEMRLIININLTKGVNCNKFKVLRLEYLDTEKDKIISDYFDMTDTVFQTKFSLSRTSCNLEKINVL